MALAVRPGDPAKLDLCTPRPPSGKENPTPGAVPDGEGAVQATTRLVFGAMLAVSISAAAPRDAPASECALTLYATPPTRTARSLAYACGAGCAFTVQVCRAVPGDGCDDARVARLQVTSQPDATLAAAVIPPAADADCGPATPIVLPAETRRRVRVVARDADGVPLDRDGLLLDCRADTGWLGCLPVTTTTSTLPGGGCVVSGCSGELCGSEPAMSPCVWTPSAACFREARCARQADGACGWTPTPALAACLRAADG